MDPKLRPSFPELVKRLEEILCRLKAEESGRERIPLSGENDKKTIPKGDVSNHLISEAPSEA